MATYEEIYGKRVEVLDTDPTLTSAYEGQVWYNSTTGTLKSVVQFGAWRSGADITYNAAGAGATGPNTANLVFSGYGYPTAPAGITTSAEFNGSGWTATPSLNEGRTYLSGAGTATAGLAIAGLDPPPGGNPSNRSDLTEEYNGTSWSEQGDLSNARGQAVGYGTQTAGVCATGDQGPPDYSTLVEDYNGTAWTAGTAVSLGRRSSTGNGSSTSAIIISGNVSPSDTKTALTEEWDGSSWSSGGNVNTARKGAFASGASQDSSLFFGGTAGPGVTTATEEYDGSAWTTTPATMVTPQTDNQQGGGSNVATAAMIAGGWTSAKPTQEYEKSINTITSAAWAAGGNLPNARYANTGCGTQTAAICVGGGDPEMNTVSKYDGTSWTNSTSLPGTRRNMAVFGTQTATGAGQGFASAPSVTATYFEFDGSSWSAEEAVPYSAFGSAGLGTTAAGLVTGGNPGAVTTCAEYGGESWTGGGAISNGRWYIAGSGTQTAGLIFGGDSPGASNSTEEYDGSSWTAGGNLITGLRGIFPSTAGTQTATLCAGGSVDPPQSNQASTYDGSAWATAPNLSTARELGAGGGDSTTGLVAGGLTVPGPASNATEEFSGETETVTASTLTTA